MARAVVIQSVIGDNALKDGPMEAETDQSLVEIDESLDIVISDDEDEDPQISAIQNNPGNDGLSFKEISEEWKMVSWFTESICVR